MPYQTILFELKDNIARLTLNRPDKLNSFNEAMHVEVRDALNQVKANGARVLLITGAGRAFCAGQDLSDRQIKAGESSVDLGESIEKYYAPLVRTLRALPLPVVAGVNGVAAGAGVSLALACDLVIATKSANFIQSFAKLGLIPDTGGTFFLPRLVGPARALGMAMLGDRLTAEQAAAWGLIWRCVEDEAFASAVDQLVNTLANAPTKGLAYTKAAINQSAANSLDQQLDLERDYMRELGYSNDFREGATAFLEKRPPKFTGT
ncbi:MAG TPA: 2-(1,2-epoxy-1,2-dihydrophenyl)acetyl-CoA isomerase PaaG [Chthoniobacterales bacterium]|nr:2-(1,2-epoxy-1,2-dihydrophenyl)acetyl-CoA isomerase PaaG [Chthoniobacterales bacterium]